MELARHGVRPGPDTPPEIVREFINDLYVYEIRSLREKMRAGLIEKREYASYVDRLRRRYPILSLPINKWREAE